MINSTWQSFQKPSVLFIGLSAKPNCEHLSPITKTGIIVEKIGDELPSVDIFKTNLVKTPPLDINGNLRYPNQNEMLNGWKELRAEIIEISPLVIVMLGQQVSFFLRSQIGIDPIKPKLPPDFSSKEYISQSSAQVLSVHHPSFVYVYRRNEIDSYVQNVSISISILINRFDPNNYFGKYLN